MNTLDDTHYTKKKLKERGWNDRLIEQLLGDPDKTRINMHCKSGPEVCFYAKERVHAAESRTEFVEAQPGRLVRSERSLRAAETQRNQMGEYVEGIEVSVPQMDEATLTAQAIAHYNVRHDGVGDRAFESSDPEFLNRIRVNYLRHQCTGYDQHLDETKGKVGRSEACVEIKEKILDAIADAYPMLTKECSRQKQEALGTYLLDRRS